MDFSLSELESDGLFNWNEGEVNNLIKPKRFSEIENSKMNEQSQGLKLMNTNVNASNIPPIVNPAQVNLTSHPSACMQSSVRNSNWNNFISCSSSGLYNYPPTTQIFPHPTPHSLERKFNHGLTTSYDAPNELRWNYMQHQANLMQQQQQQQQQQPFGITVNGFHPQVNAAENPLPKKVSAKERNEREQKRAQKITELIECLRQSMVKGGWKVELKSKYHTLSKCTEYVKNLIETTKEKELAIERIKSQMSCSNMEHVSVTSSLTNSSSDKSVSTDKHQISSISFKENKGSSLVSNMTDSNVATSSSEEGKALSRIQLDYEEVFMTSNVPQVIATTAGRIMTWNKCFLKATGLTAKQTKRLTLFSIVRIDKLCNLFEIASKTISDEMEKDCQSVTLPCIPFPSSSNFCNDFYMTVTFIDDEESSKRCLHCILTDSQGPKQSMGSVSPDLLVKLFGDDSSQSNKRQKMSPDNSDDKNDPKETNHSPDK